MAGRVAWQQRMQKYLSITKAAHKSGNEKLEEHTLKEWVGVAKADMSRDQLVQVLHFIYTNIRPSNEAEDFLLDTYFTKVAD